MRLIVSAATLFIAASIFAQSSGNAPKIKISFVPPPLEGTFSLGIYDEWGQLVRVLHQEADVDEFAIGPDALVTSWDGKDIDGSALPKGTYRARGFVVGKPNIQAVTSTDIAGPAAASVRLKLVANPLEKDERGVVDITVGIDDENAFIKTVDGLPLVTVAPSNGATKAWLTAGRENKVVAIRVGDGADARGFDVSGLDKMMAFDCGEIELK